MKKQTRNYRLDSESQEAWGLVAEAVIAARDAMKPDDSSGWKRTVTYGDSNGVPWGGTRGSYLFEVDSDGSQWITYQDPYRREKYEFPYTPSAIKNFVERGDWTVVSETVHVPAAVAHEMDRSILQELDMEDVGELASAYKGLKDEYDRLAEEFMIIGTRVVGYEEAMELFIRRMEDDDGIDPKDAFLMFKRRLLEVAK